MNDNLNDIHENCEREAAALRSQLRAITDKTGDGLTKLMNLPVTGFDNDGEETVSREAAAEIVRSLEANAGLQIAELQAERRRLEIRIVDIRVELNESQAEITRLWQIAYNGEYSKARNWGADHEQADTYALRVAGESSLEDLIRKAKEE